MNDQHAPTSGYEFLIGLSGMFSPWWFKLVHAIDATVAGVTFYGGALLVAIQLGRWGAAKVRKWRGGTP